MGEVRRLYRSRDQKMIAGVCGGIAEYTRVDPTLVRILMLALMFFGGIGLLPYIILWIVIPEEPYYGEGVVWTKRKNNEDE
jgi:phage shock protein C